MQNPILQEERKALLELISRLPVEQHSVTERFFKGIEKNEV